jgi:hypothetical protein
VSNENNTLVRVLSDPINSTSTVYNSSGTVLMIIGDLFDSCFYNDLQDKVSFFSHEDWEDCLPVDVWQISFLAAVVVGL